MNVLVKNVFTIILFGIALAIPFASAAMTDPSSEPLTAYSMFINADWVVKSVMLLLLLASITSWSILLLKKLELNKALNSCADIRSKLILDLDLLEAQKIVNNLYVETQLITVALNECEWADKHVSSPQGVKERLAQRLVSTQAELIEKASYGVGILASIGSTAPFIGLLGTVWGIMNSFVGIAEAKKHQFGSGRPRYC
jgi:biopolymer transport protein ExbB